ncbi:MAG TPA: polysaccharide deacetylase family protein [Nitrososphaeraceae archaeon]|nr:polysaccharide deacetylase family protein [Nitrososphaeraceae archaeon]
MKKSMNTLQQFVSLSYHYVRPKINPFPRILGNDVDEFQNHIKMLQKNYSIISPNDILDFYYGARDFDKSKNILLTFDDGLSEHFEVAKILHECDIKAIFFIPTCILDERLPANPMIIHYCIAEFGIGKFLKTYNEILKELKLMDNKDYDIQYNESHDNAWDKINKIKFLFKYKIEHTLSRKILIKIFEDLFMPKFPRCLEMIHLDENKVRGIINMGHTIGTHSHTHLSIGATKLNSNDLEKELIYPKKFLEKKFGIEISSFSYPFGETQDCLSAPTLLTITKEYKLAFNLEEKMNTKNTSPLQLGRIMPTSAYTTEKLSDTIEKIFRS